MSEPFSAVLDFDGYLSKLPEDRRGTIEAHLGNVTEAERNTEKQRLASILAVSEVTGSDVADVAENWSVFRGAYAEQQGWSDVDEPNFFAKIREQATKQKDERELLIGPEDQNEQGIAESLVFKAHEAAYKGGTYADALSEWEAAHNHRPGYDGTKASKYADFAAEEFQAMSDRLARVKPKAEEAFEKISRFRTAEGGEAAPFGAFRGLSPEDKNLAFRLMTDMAGKPDPKSTWEVWEEGVNRGFENAFMGASFKRWHTKLLTSRFRAGDTVSARDAVSEVGLLFQDEQAANVLAGEGMASPQARGATRQLSAEEAKVWNQQLLEAREDVETAEQLRKFGQQVIDNPDAAPWLARKILGPAAESIALMAMLQTTGPIGLDTAAQMYAGDEYMRLRSLGMDEKQADSLALVSGAAQAGLDRLQLGVLTKGVPFTRKALEKFALAGSNVARFGVNFAGTLVAETAIEMTQDHIVPAIVQDNLANDPQFDVKWHDVWRDAAKAMPDVALGMVLLSGLGGIAQTAQQTAWVTQLSGSPAAMRLRGYTPEQIEQIQNAPADQKGQLLSQYLPAEAPRGEARKALVSEVTALAAQEKAAFDLKAQADAANAMENEAARVSRRASGWWVQFGNQSVQVESAEAARRIRDDLKQASSREEATALVNLIDAWTQAAPEGVSREVTLTGELVTTDGQSVQRSKWLDTYEDGSFDAQAMEELRKEAALLGAGEVFGINGSNSFKAQLIGGATQLLQRLEINQGESSVFTFLHEAVESEFRRTGSQQQAQQAIAAMRTAFDPLKAKDAQQQALFERVQKIADGQASETELRETFSELAVADILGRNKDGTLVEAGSVSRALDAAIQDAVDAKTARTLGKVRAFFRAVKAYFRSLFATVAAIRKAKRSGQAEEFEGLVERLLGISEQEEHDAQLSEEVADYIPPTAEELEAGIAFNVSDRKGAGQLARARTKNGITFSTPYVGKTGAKILGYSWRNIEGERFSAKEGGMVEALVSDWASAETNPDTNRQIVHLFAVQLTDGTTEQLSAESAAKRLGVSQSTIRTNAIKELKKQQAEIEEANRFAQWAETAEGSPSMLEAYLSSYAPFVREKVRGQIMAGDQGSTATLLTKDGLFYKPSGVWKRLEELGEENGFGVVNVSGKSALNAQALGTSFSLSKLTQRFSNRGVKAKAQESRAEIILEDVNVRESIRGHGIGSEFMRELTAYADRKGKRIVLGNNEAEKFFAKFGFAGGKREPGEPAFSVSAGNRLELVMQRLDKALAKDPQKRRELAKQAQDKLQALAFNWENERWTGKGDEIRPLVEKRTPEQIKSEADIREAFRREELEAAVFTRWADVLGNEELGNVWSGPVMSALAKPGSKLHGRIKSKSAAMRSQFFSDKSGDYDGIDGVPGIVFGGDLAPDQAAQELFDEGILPDPSVDALWQAIKQEVGQAQQWKAFLKAAKEDLRTARETARDEAKAWQEEQAAMQKKDWSPKARLVRDLRTLDAILSVMPAEVRGQVGGFVKLAQLGSDEARAKEIGNRIGKLEGLLERHLKTESTEALKDLLEKAKPDREGGKKSKGKLGADAHRYFDEVSRVYTLTEAEVEGERAAIAVAHNEPSLTPEQALDLFEREQILDTFGAWDKKTAADMDSAVRSAQEVFDQGRNRWRTLEEARLTELRELAGQVVDSLGGTSYAASQAQKAGGKLRFLRKASLDLKSFAEVLDTLLGKNHPLAKRWSDAAREGFAQRNDEVRALRKRWKAALEAATGKEGVKARRALWDMAREQTIEVDNAGARSGSTVEVPIDLIDLWRQGLADPSALGYSVEEAEWLVSQREQMEADDRRQNIALARGSRADAETVKMSEAEGIFLTMLAGQEQYQEALDKAGWTTDAVDAIEARLSDPAKKLRAFMRQEYRDGYGPLAAQFESMFGVALPQIKNYAPAAFYHVGTEREMSVEGGISEGGMRSGFLKNRKQHTAAPKLENAFATFFGHVAQTAHWKGLAPFIREFSGVMGKPEVKRAIEAKHGPEMVSTLSAWIKNLEGNGLQQNSGLLDRAVSWITSSQAYIALAFKLGTLAKQSTALLGAAFRMPLGAYARGFAKLVTGQLEVRKLLESPAIQRRLETGFAPEVRAALADIWNAKPTLRSRALEAGMELIGWTDAIFTTGSAAIAYDYHFAQAKAAGLSNEAAEQAAMREVEDIISRTAQPADIVNRSLFEARLNSFGRLLFMFASEARQKSSLWLTAWGNTLSGQATKDDLRVLAISHLIVAPLLQTITAAWRDSRDDDDDEIFDAENWNGTDYLKAVVAGPLSGVPLINEALSGFRSDGILGRFAKAPGRLVDLFEGPEENEAEKTEWYFDRITKLMQAADAFTGVAGSVADQLGSMADNFLPDSPEEQEKKERAAIRREQREARE